MKKNLISRIIIILSIITILFANCSFVYASTDKSIWELAKEWLKLGEEQRSESALGDESYQGFEEIAGLLWGSGLFVIAIVGVILGIRYMISPPEEKANLKKMLIAYLVGTVLILGAAGIWKFLVDFLEDIAQN